MIVSVLVLKMNSIKKHCWTGLLDAFFLFIYLQFTYLIRVVIPIYQRILNWMIMLKLAYVFEGFTPCFYKSDTVVGRYENENGIPSEIGIFIAMFLVRYNVKFYFGV